jgi:hypothetical protein
MDPFMALEALAIFGTSLHAEKLWLAVLRAPAGGWRRGTGRFVGSVGKYDGAKGDRYSPAPRDAAALPLV